MRKLRMSLLLTLFTLMLAADNGFAKQVTIVNDWQRCIHYVADAGDHCKRLKPVSVTIHCEPNCSPDSIQLDGYYEHANFEYPAQATLHLRYTRLIDTSDIGAQHKCSVRDTGITIKTKSITQKNGTQWCKH